jgi:hypothetical protein
MNGPFAKVPNGTFELIAAQLGAAGVDWAIERLRRYAPIIGSPIKADDDSFDREAFESALCLEHWLMIETKAQKMIGEDIPDCIDDVSIGLHDLLPLIARYIRQPRKGGRTPDYRRYICAWVCSEIWQEVHGAYQPRSERLWEACEAYWLACGQPETSAVDRVKNWERYLLNRLVSHP